MRLESPYFRLLEEGEFQAEEVRIKIVPSSRVVPEELQERLDELWENYQGPKNPDDEKITRYRFEGLDTEDGTLVLRVSLSLSYKDYQSYNLYAQSDHDPLKEFGSYAEHFTLATGSLNVTSDNKVVLTRRSLWQVRVGACQVPEGQSKLEKMLVVTEYQIFFVLWRARLRRNWESNFMK